jgi:hypothetical protein
MSDEVSSSSDSEGLTKAMRNQKDYKTLFD